MKKIVKILSVAATICFTGVGFVNAQIGSAGVDKCKLFPESPDCKNDGATTSLTNQQDINVNPFIGQTASGIDIMAERPDPIIPGGGSTPNPDPDTNCTNKTVEDFVTDGDDVFFCSKTVCE